MKKYLAVLRAINVGRADIFSVEGREVYNLRRVKDNSVFSNEFIEKIMGMPSTTRNLNIVRKIVEKVP